MLRKLRRERSLSQEEVAERVGVSPVTYSCWERGVHRPQAAQRRRLAEVFQVPVEELGLESVLAGLELEREDLPRLEDVQEAVLRLRRSYSTSSPRDLLPRIDARLRQLRRLLSLEHRRPQRRGLLEATAWLTLLRGTVLNDLSLHEAAQSAIYVARMLAQDLRHGDLEAWVYETAAWIAATDERLADAVELATAGIAVGPKGGHGLVAATLQRARVRATLGNEAGAVQDLLAGERAHGAVGMVDWPDDHYALDPSKAAFYASGALAALRRPKETIEHAAEVIRANQDPSTNNYWPTRVGSARLEWAMALVDQGEEDEALTMAQQVLRVPWHFRAGHAQRTRRLLERMRDDRLRDQLRGELEERLADLVGCAAGSGQDHHSPHFVQEAGRCHRSAIRRASAISLKLQRDPAIRAWLPST